MILQRLSINQTTTFRWPFEEDVARYAASGFRAIGVWRHKLSDLDIDDAIELLALHDLNVSHLFWAGGFTGSDGCRFQDSVDDAIDAIRTAAQLGSPCLIVHSGARAGHTRKHARRLLCDALTELLPVAETLDVTLALEPMLPGANAGMTFLSNVDEALDVIDAMADRRLKLVLDLYHQAHDDNLSGRIAALADRVALVQLGDASCLPSVEPDRQLLGEGKLPLGPIIDELEMAGYTGFYDVELIGQSLESYSYDEILRHTRQAFYALAERTRLSRS